MDSRTSLKYKGISWCPHYSHGLVEKTGVFGLNMVGTNIQEGDRLMTSLGLS